MELGRSYVAHCFVDIINSSLHEVHAHNRLFKTTTCAEPNHPRCSLSAGLSANANIIRTESRDTGLPCWAKYRKLGYFLKLVTAKNGLCRL